MADMISNLALGFAVVFSLKTLALCFLGCLIGTLIGVLPGIGPVATIAMLLPVTFGIDPVDALIMLIAQQFYRLIIGVEQRRNGRMHEGLRLRHGL